MKTALSVLFLSILLLQISSSVSFAQVTSAGSGNWSDGSTWIGGAVPPENADVIIADDHKVVLDADAVCNNLTINGTLEFENVTARSLTVHGDITGDSLKTSSLDGVGPLIHTITLHGNLSLTSLFDLRYGSNPNVGAADLILTGNSNSTLSGPSNMDINGVTIDKSGGAKVILASNFYQNNNSSNLPLGILQLTNGIVETGDFEWHVKATGSAAGVLGGSKDSYVKGNLVRYMPSGSPVRVYPIGDDENYSPIEVELVSSISNTPLKVSVIHGNANTGSSTFSGDIDMVSKAHYYELSNLSNGPMNFKALSPSYGLNDGVESGNTDLRVAVSTDDRATWMDIGPSAADTNAHTTNVSDQPNFIRSDDIPGNLTIAAHTSFFAALAKASGTSTNSLPVELTAFSASISNKNVILNWFTASEKNNRGFEIERKIHSGNWEVIGFAAGFGTTTEAKSYSYTDQNLAPAIYSYRLKQIDFDGSFSYSQIVNVDLSAPSEYLLMQNYPNPFNPSTMISFRIKNDSHVSLKIFDVLGNEVAVLLNSQMEAGDHQLEFNSTKYSGLTSGVYYYTLTAADGSDTFSETRKMVVLK